MTDPAFHTRPDGARLAHHWTPPQPGRPVVVFCGGLNSSMAGSKAEALEKFAKDRGDGYLRFDYRGHGLSDGDFVDGSISDWLDDALTLLDAVVVPTGAPVILVGSSMGGWISLLLAQRRRIAGLVTIAAACDFTEERIVARLGPEQRADLEKQGWFERPSRYGDGPYKIGAKLLEDGKTHLLLRTPIDLDIPVRLLHGQADPDVDWRTSLRIMGQLTGQDVRLILVKDGDHRLARDEDIALIDAEVSGLGTTVSER